MDYSYRLKKIKEKREIPEEEFKSAESYLELYLLKNYSDLSIPKNEIKKVVDFIDGIFSSMKNYSLSSHSRMSVAYPSKFHRYFAYSLLEGNLSEIDFSKARTLSQDEFNGEIYNWISQGLESELQNRFEEIKDFDSKEDFEKVIKAIFYLANCKSINEKRYRPLIGYNGADLFYKLSDDEARISEKFYKSKEELKYFISGLFEKAKPPFAFESNFIRHINKQLSRDSFPLSQPELKKIVLDYFKRYLDQIDKIDDQFWNLFHSCKATRFEEQGTAYRSYEETTEEAKEIMKEFISKKDLDNFLVSMINVEAFKGKRFSIGNFPLELFGSWENFKQFLEKQDELLWQYLEEFKQFYTLAESNNFSQYISFEFKIIPADKLRR